LSSRDKEFDKPNGGKEKEGTQPNGFQVVYQSRFPGEGDKDEKPTKTKVSFAGALSIGIDEISNTLIVSAQEEWMPAITDIIQTLDQPAVDYDQAATVVNTPVDRNNLKQILSRLPRLSGKIQVVGQQPDQKQQQNGQQNQNGQQQGQNGNQQADAGKQ
jgi:type II secretory pathway component GspD/PulD (secretin)